MSKRVFKDGLVHGTLYSAELGCEVDQANNNATLSYWEFSATLDKGAVQSEGEPVTHSRRFYVPAMIAAAVKFATDIGWNRELGQAAKFTKPGVSCRATYKPPFARQDGKPGYASNNFSELMPEMSEADVKKAMLETFGAAPAPVEEQPTETEAAKKKRLAAEAAKAAST